MIQEISSDRGDELKCCTKHHEACGIRSGIDLSVRLLDLRVMDQPLPA